MLQLRAFVAPHMHITKHSLGHWLLRVVQTHELQPEKAGLFYCRVTAGPVGSATSGETTACPLPRLPSARAFNGHADSVNSEPAGVTQVSDAHTQWQSHVVPNTSSSSSSAAFPTCAQVFSHLKAILLKEAHTSSCTQLLLTRGGRQSPTEIKRCTLPRPASVHIPKSASFGILIPWLSGADCEELKPKYIESAK